MKQRLFLAVFLVAVTGCGSSELNRQERFPGGFKRHIDAQIASYGEPSGCRPLPLRALDALTPAKYRKQSSEDEREELLKSYALVRGKPLTEGPADLAKATYYAAYRPLDLPVPAVALSGQAVRTGRGTVLREKEYEALSDTAITDANRARACALKGKD